MDHRVTWKMKNYNTTRRYHLEFGDDCLDKTPEAKSMRENTVGWTSFKLETSVLGIVIKKMKSQTGSVFAKYLPSKRLVYKIYTELLKISNEKTNKLILEMGESSKQTP